MRAGSAVLPHGRIVGVVQTASMSCTGCGHVFADFAAANEIDERGQRVLACPECGSVEGRNASIAASDNAMATDAITGLSVTKGDLRPWEEKWLKLLDALHEIRDLYATGRSGESSTRLERRFDDFFTTCFDMGDWLIHDARLPKEDVNECMKSEHSLALARAVSNTEKHHTRSGGVTARIRTVELVGGVRVSIEEDWSMPTRSTHDALDVAEAAIVAWRRFLGERGLQPPA